MTCSRLVLQTPGLCVLGGFREETEVTIPAWGLRARQPSRPGYASLPHRASLCPPVKWGCEQPWPPRAVVWVWCPSAFIQKACSPLLPMGLQPWADKTGNLGESLAWVQVRQRHHLSVSISRGVQWIRTVAFKSSSVLSTCVASGSFLNLSDPQSSCLKQGSYNNSTVGLL